MSRMSDAHLLAQEMCGWSTEKLMNAWAFSDDPAERYAAAHLVRVRAADAIELEQELLPRYGREHPEKMKQVTSGSEDEE